MKSKLLVFSSVISAFVHCLWNLSSATNHEDTFLYSLLEILSYLLLLELWPNWQCCFVIVGEKDPIIRKLTQD